jgi:hypothetical protein
LAESQLLLSALFSIYFSHPKQYQNIFYMRGLFEIFPPKAHLHGSTALHAFNYIYIQILKCERVGASSPH